MSGATCGKCGARAAPTLDVPDLDLSAVSAPPPAVRAAPRKNSGAIPKAVVVSAADDILADDPGEASFELEIEPGDRSVPPGIVAAAPTSSPSLSGPPSGPRGPMSGPPSNGGPARTTSGAMPRVSAPPASDPRDANAPSSMRDSSGSSSNAAVRVSAPPAEPRIDPNEAARFADYGPPPQGALQAPAYAFRVKMRQSELRRGLWRAKLAFERAQKERSSAEADTSRLEEVKLRLMAECEAKEHEVDLHEAALAAFDAKAMKLGMQIVYAVAFVLTVAIVLPVFLRMCIGVEPPPLNPQ